MKNLIVIISAVFLLTISLTLIIASYAKVDYAEKHNDPLLSWNISDEDTNCSVALMSIELINDSEGLSCSHLANCNNGASCDGPGRMLGPCTIKCGDNDQAPEINCGEKQLML